MSSKIEPIELVIDDTHITVTPCEADINDDLEVTVSSIEVSIDKPFYQVLSEPVEWDEESIEEQVRNPWLAGEEPWPETVEVDWSEHTNIRRDSDIFKVLEFITQNYLTTTSEINEEDVCNDAAKNPVSTLKSKNLIRGIGKTGNTHLLVPTHLGFKEVYHVHGTVDSDNTYDYEKTEEQLESEQLSEDEKVDEAITIDSVKDKDW